MVASVHTLSVSTAAGQTATSRVNMIPWATASVRRCRAVGSVADRGQSWRRTPTHPGRRIREVKRTWYSLNQSTIHSEKLLVEEANTKPFGTLDCANIASGAPGDVHTLEQAPRPEYEARATAWYQAPRRPAQRVREVPRQQQPETVEARIQTPTTPPTGLNRVEFARRPCRCCCAVWNPLLRSTGVSLLLIW
jgi:hypothetical protein